MQNKTMKEISPMLEAYIGKEKSRQIIQLAGERLVQLIEGNQSDAKAVKTHTENNIFPCISLYEAMQQCDVSKDEALAVLDESWSHRAQKKADSISKGA